MKRKFKLIVPSFLTLIFCLLLIAGSTFALFTSQAEASIEVTSGKVDLDATLSNMQAYSAEAVSDEVYETLTDAEKASNAEAFGVNSKYKYTLATQSSTNEKLWTFATGGTAQLSNDNLSLTLDKVVPGDKVTLQLNLINYSNINIKYRVRVVASIDTGLLAGLDIKVNDQTLEGAIRAGEWTKLNYDPANTPKTLTQNIEVVLPIDAGNEYQDKEAKLRFFVEAVQGNAKTDNLLAQMNAVLKATGKHNTFYDAIQELKNCDDHYSEDTITQYVWNSKYDQLVPENELEEAPVKYFKAYTTMPASQTFSIYAQGNWSAQDLIGLKVGFDAGDTTGITSIAYTRNGESDKAQEVIIRTNDMNTTLIVNAPKDVVHHYGVAGYLKIEAVANSSYHENGTIAFLEIKTGRVALEETSVVEQIHLATTDVVEDNVVVDKVFDNIIISKAEEVKMPELSRDPVTIPEEGKLVVELQDSTNEETANSDFIWLTAVGIYEQVAISDNGEKVELTTNEQVQYAAQLTGETEEVAEKRTAAQQIANNITFSDSSNNNYKVVAEQNAQGEWKYDVKKLDNEGNITSDATVYTADSTKVNNVETVVVTDNTDSNNPVQLSNEVIKVENGLNPEEKTAAQAEAKESFVVATITANNTTNKYYTLEEALNALQNGQTVQVIKDTKLNSKVVLAASTSQYAVTMQLVNANVEFVEDGEISFDVVGLSCRFNIAGNGKISTKLSDKVMFTKGTNGQVNEVIVVNSENITIEGGKFTSCKLSLYNGTFKTQIVGVAESTTFENSTKTRYSHIYGGYYSENIVIFTDTTKDVVTENNLYKVINHVVNGNELFYIEASPITVGDELITRPNAYLDEASLGLLGDSYKEGGYVDGYYTATLLRNHTAIDHNNSDYPHASPMKYLPLDGQNIVLDLNGFTISSPNGIIIGRNNASLGNVTIKNGKLVSTYVSTDKNPEILTGGTKSYTTTFENVEFSNNLKTDFDQYAANGQYIVATGNVLYYDSSDTFKYVSLTGLEYVASINNTIYFGGSNGLQLSANHVQAGDTWYINENPESVLTINLPKDETINVQLGDNVTVELSDANFNGTITDIHYTNNILSATARMAALVTGGKEGTKEYDTFEKAWANKKTGCTIKLLSPIYVSNELGLSSASANSNYVDKGFSMTIDFNGFMIITNEDFSGYYGVCNFTQHNLVVTFTDSSDNKTGGIKDTVGLPIIRDNKSTITLNLEYGNFITVSGSAFSGSATRNISNNVNISLNATN